MTGLKCPNCGQTYDLDTVEIASIYDQRTGLAAKLGQAWPIANEYVDCFRTQRGAVVSLKKRVRILAELAQLWESCEYEYDGKRYRTEKRAILEALRVTCNADKCGFENHNYVKKVLLATAQRVSSEGLTAKEETERHVSRRGTEHAEEGAEKISLDEAMKRRGIESLASGLLKHF